MPLGIYPLKLNGLCFSRGACIRNTVRSAHLTLCAGPSEPPNEWDQGVEKLIIIAPIATFLAIDAVLPSWIHTAPGSIQCEWL